MINRVRVGFIHNSFAAASLFNQTLSNLVQPQLVWEKENMQSTMEMMKINQESKP